MCSDTIIGEIANNIEFDYFHNKDDRHRVIQLSEKIPSLDKRFIMRDKKRTGSEFACDAPFIRGCVSIRRKN